MKAESIHKYFWFGTCVRYLQDVTTGYQIHGSRFILGNMESFFKHVNELGLIVTQRCSAFSDLKMLQSELAKLDQDERLSAEQAKRLSDIMDDIRNTLAAEIRGFQAFIVTPKRIDTQKLLDDVSLLFAPGVFAALPDIAKYDCSEAGKCIAFERPTAAAFHILRATESVLRYFYCHHVSHKRVKELLWGPIVNDLRTRSKTKKYTTLHNNLDNIRLSFRNPTQHPEKAYDINEVQDLWALCGDVINRMIKIIDPNLA